MKTALYPCGLVPQTIPPSNLEKKIRQSPVRGTFSNIPDKGRQKQRKSKKLSEQGKPKDTWHETHCGILDGKKDR